MTKISNLDSLFMVDGQIFAHAAKPRKEPVDLSLGAAQIPMQPCQREALDIYAFARRENLSLDEIAQHTRSTPAEQAPGEVFALWVNHLSDWTLSGHQTLQMMFTDPDLPVEVEIERPLETSTRIHNLFFHARLATHRARADLNVTIRDTETGETKVHKVAFDPAFSGGKVSDSYQTVTLPLPALRPALEIGLAVEYSEYMDDGSGIEPFLFIADIHVGPESGGQNRQDLQLTPHVIRGRGLSENGAWYSAPLPGCAVPGQFLKLTSGSETEKMPLPAGPTLKIAENYGHTLIIESDSEIDLLLYVDGQPDDLVSLSTGHTPVRLQARHLDGLTHTLSLRDVSGSITHWAGQVLVPYIVTPADVLQREGVAPFPDTIFAQTARRYAGLKRLMAHIGPDSDTAQLAHAIATLEGGYEKVRLKPLRFAQVAEPEVSIVIPAHNKVEVTYLALCSLLLAHNRTSFEIIVVDDASSDETATLEEIVSGITVLHNTEPQRFIRACNAGAAEARGTYIVLLNNDVEVTAGWLDALVDAFSRFDDVGLVGSKLLYPDGTLQDAGGIIWGSGNPWNYGNRQNPNAPAYCYARQADYLSGAALMAPRDVWEEVGGLSSYLEPMYFEDTDLAFKVRKAGYSTWFIPDSVVYHYEGMTSGTDVGGSGFKRYQEVNRPKFKRRWAEAYRQFGREGERPDLEKDRGTVGRVLFIDYATPRPDQDAGSYAALQEIRMVQSLGYKVSFLPTNMAHMGSYTEELQRMGVEMIYAPFFVSPSEYLNQHARDFDAFYLTRYYVAQDVLPQIRTLAPQASILFNNADLHFLREIRTAQAAGDSALLEKARQTRTEEMRVIEQVDVVLSYNEMEHSVIEAYTEGHARVLRTPWVVDVPAEISDLQARHGLSFLGSFRHHPNAEGVLWFARDVMPLVASGLTLSIYGSRMSDEIKALASEAIKPVGFVENAADAYEQHRIFVAPLLSGAGIKGKVLAALAHGIPCVLSPVAAEGIGLRSGHDCFIAHTPEEWVTAIKTLNEDDALWQSLSENARLYMKNNYAFDQGREAMRAAFEAADLYSSIA